MVGLLALPTNDKREAPVSMKTKIKYLIPLVLFLSQFAWPQVETGSVIFADFEQDEITIAADSRKNIPENGSHDDSECKISAFGKKFVFSLAGTIERSGHWNARSVARKTWESESKVASKTPLLDRVVAGWIKAMWKFYGEPDTISNIKKHMTGDPVVATAIFAALDKSDTLRMKAVNIDFDPRLFDTENKVKLIDDVSEIPANSHVSMGHDEIAEEFYAGASPRAKDYMTRYVSQIAGLPLHQRRAELFSKLIELSVSLHPNKDQLALPVDVLQIRKGTGVYWARVKPNCPEK